jgi:hypothetical protein
MGPKISDVSEGHGQAQTIPSSGCVPAAPRAKEICSGMMGINLSNVIVGGPILDRAFSLEHPSWLLEN